MLIYEDGIGGKRVGRKEGRNSFDICGWIAEVGLMRSKTMTWRWEERVWEEWSGSSISGAAK